MLLFSLLELCAFAYFSCYLAWWLASENIGAGCRILRKMTFSHFTQPESSLTKLPLQETYCNMVEIYDFALESILRFMEENQHAFVVSVSRRWKNVYETVREDKNTSATAAEGAQLEFLVDKFGYTPRKEGLQAAILKGNLDYIKLACRSGFKWNQERYCEAAEKGHLHVIRWARESGYPWDTWTCEAAAAGGHLELLKWLRLNECPWDETICSAAARKGHLKLLEWAWANGCPWDEWTCAFAALEDQIEILQWARENGCPWDGWTLIYAQMRGNLQILEWARAHGCQ